LEFLTDDAVAQPVTYQRVTFDALAPRCGRYGCATAGLPGPFTGESQDRMSVYEVTAAPAG
jgi:hypothetical protein